MAIQSMWKGTIAYRESLVLQESLKKELQCASSDASRSPQLVFMPNQSGNGELRHLLSLGKTLTKTTKLCLYESKELLTKAGAKQDQYNKGTPKAFLIGFECPACITLGLRGKEETDLNKAVEEYKKKKIEIVPIKRGGQATLHSPGQLVIYPVMSLLQWKIRPREFLSILEKITQDILEQYGILAEKREEAAGLFTRKGKIAFFGIHISGGISQHGLAINVHNDLKLFNLIRSCGVSRRPHDSFQSYNLCPNLKEVFSLWCQTAKETFSKHYLKRKGL
ncbi:MAG: lipoyl(octanoyl) transferase LipB [Bdellovibrionales bacterium]|nr:lipoyl(octanoyl) transferase LipB [Bdellovibrionales bacterium]